jgi:hypothetical protein
MTTRRLRVQGQSFRDPQNREIILRGVNLAGDLRSHDHQHFLDADNVSFVGRPFPLEHADAHFQRLRRLGYNTIRYTFTWEAIEHAGPGRYDTEWVEFTVEILRIAKKYQFYIFMEPYQDFVRLSLSYSKTPRLCANCLSGLGCQEDQAHPHGPSTQPD